ncbi:MAG: hypothetical protein ACR2IF_15130 [Terriglobales bacterium]
MKKESWLLLCVLCVLCGSGFSLDRTAFTFTSYNLELRVDPAGQAIATRGTIRLRNDSTAPQRTLVLQISSSLDWRMIEFNGKPLQYVATNYTTDLDHTGAVREAVVSLPAAVAPKASVELQVGYAGALTRNTMRLENIGVPASTATRTDWDQVAEPVTAVRGIGYVAWYPVSLPAAKLSDNTLFTAVNDWKNSQRDTTMRVNLCWIAESDLTVVANGSLEGVNRHLLGADEQGETSTNAGCSVYSFGSLASTVPSFAIAAYSALDRPSLTVYHLPPQQAAAQEYAAAGEKVLPFETQWFPAPQSKVQVVQLGDQADAPFESGPLLFTPLLLVSRNDIQAIMIHQLAHASLHSPRPWIEEGLARFAQALERERQGGRTAAIAYMQGSLPALQAVEADATAEKRATQSLLNSNDEILFRVKAMYVWWMLRDLVGDEVLRRAIHQYRAADDRSATYMPHLIAQAAKRDLEWFFDDWVYRDRGLPDFTIESAYPRTTLNGSYVVTVTVKNAGGAAAVVPFTVRAPGGERTQRVQVNARSEAVERVELPQMPTEVRVNDGSVPELNMNNNSLLVAPK